MIEQQRDATPPRHVTGVGAVDRRQIVDERDPGSPRQQGIDVETERAGRIRRIPDSFEVAEAIDRERPALRVDGRHHHIGAALAAPGTFLEHRERLADAGHRTQVDPEVTAWHPTDITGRRRNYP